MLTTMDESPLKKFADTVEAFLARTGMSIGKFGDLACNDRNFVSDMRKGQREFKYSTMRKVEAFMAGWDSVEQTVDGGGDAAATSSGRAA